MIKRFVVACLLICCLIGLHRGETIEKSGNIILENSNARWQFDRQSFGLQSIALKFINSSDAYSCMNGLTPNQIWILSFRDVQGVEYLVDGSAPTETMKYELATGNSTATLYLHWINTTIKGTNSSVNVSVQIVLQPSGLAESKILIGPVGGDLALFYYNFMIVSNLAGKLLNDVVYVPNELGERKVLPSWTGDRYPSGPVSMPFMIHHSEKAKNSTMPCSRGLGLFYGVIDPTATQKGLQSFTTLKGIGFTAKLIPENNILPLTRQIESVPFLIGPFCGDWWDGSQIYRNWALKNAPWTKAGPTKSRKDIPQWFKETTLWINSHWTPRELEYDLGDPLVFERNVNRFLAVFNKSKHFNASNIAAHWYVWHQERWETNFPNYFPAKEHFDEVTKRLQAQGVRLVPYINGRIYDINTQTWVPEEGEKHCCKSSAARSKPSHAPMYIEEYENDQQWAVMCPSTSFWQKKLTSLTTEFAKKHFVDGVYIDQLASKPAALFYDPKHKHPRGGGSYWSDGYNDVLIRIRSEIDTSFALVSESNAEVYMPYLSGYLVIGGYKNCRMVPLFQAVYSDHTITFGKYFSGRLTSAPAQFTKEMATMFVYGTQLGWFALDGADGYLEFFESEHQGFIVDYIATLMRHRTLGLDYFIGGQLMRPIHNNYTRDNSHDCVPTIASAVWSSSEKNSLGIFIVNGGLDEIKNVVWKMDAVFDYAMSPAKSYVLTQVMLNGEVELLQTFHSSQIEFKTSLNGLDVYFYELHPMD